MPATCYEQNSRSNRVGQKEAVVAGIAPPCRSAEDDHPGSAEGRKKRIVEKHASTIRPTCEFGCGLRAIDGGHFAPGRVAAVKTQRVSIGSTMIDRGLFRSAGFRFGVVYALLAGRQCHGARDISVVGDGRPAGPADRSRDQCRRARPVRTLGRRRPASSGRHHRGPPGAEHRRRRDLSAGRLLMKRIAGNLASWPPSVTDGRPGV